MWFARRRRRRHRGRGNHAVVRRAEAALRRQLAAALYEEKARVAELVRAQRASAKSRDPIVAGVVVCTHGPAVPAAPEPETGAGPGVLSPARPIRVAQRLALLAVDVQPVEPDAAGIFGPLPAEAQPALVASVAV